MLGAVASCCVDVREEASPTQSRNVVCADVDLVAVRKPPAGEFRRKRLDFGLRESLVAADCDLLQPRGLPKCCERAIGRDGVENRAGAKAAESGKRPERLQRRQSLQFEEPQTCT